MGPRPGKKVNTPDRHWATLWESLADALPGAGAVVQGERRRTWGELDQRAARLAGAFAAAGIEPGARVAQFLFNSVEFVESWYAALKVRGVPVNVNYRYLDTELLYLLDNSDAEVLVFHSSLGDRVDRIRDRATKLKLLVEVDDGSPGQVPGAVAYEDLAVRSEPMSRIERPDDDPSVIYTGGTTGMPKGVMRRVGRGVAALLTAVPSTVGEAPVTTIADATGLAKRLRETGDHIISLPACPLMHATGLVIGMQTAMLLGGTVVLLDQRRFDPAELWQAVERERVNLLVVVGDPFARPMLQALDEAPSRWDLSSVRFISSSGAMFSAEVKAGLLGHLPLATVLDYISSTEGLMGVSISRHDDIAATGRFMPVPGVKVFDTDDRPVEAASGQEGAVALANGVPDAYYKDEVKSAATFREIDGVRYSFPGDFATIDTDGSLVLLGRGSQCINTGGEKVFPEEVEEVLKRDPSIEDCLVFGVADERFGQRVVAVASPTPGAQPDPAAVLDQARTELSSYKLPRRLELLDAVPRTPAGKADYPTAKRLFAERAG